MWAPCAPHLLGHRLGVKRAAAEVDVTAVGPDVDLVDGRAQLAEHLRRDVVSGAVGAIDDDLHAVQRQLLREGVLQELDVAPDRVVDALRLADRVGRGARAVVPAADRLHAALDLGLDLVGQLVPVGGEDLDAVVLVGIVRRADHHARVRAHRPGDERDPGRRQRSHQQHVGAGGHDPRLQRALQHVAGEPRVLADHDASRHAACGGTSAPPPARGAAPSRRSSGRDWRRRGCRQFRTASCCFRHPWFPRILIMFSGLRRHERRRASGRRRGRARPPRRPSPRR